MARKLLIVEDGDMLCEVLQKRLIREEYAVNACANGVDGLDYALSTPYDGIVLDVMLPRIDGIPLLIALRARSFARACRRLGPCPIASGTRSRPS